MDPVASISYEAETFGRTYEEEMKFPTYQFR